MKHALACTTLAIGMALPCAAIAQSNDDWQFRALIYGYFPDIGGTTQFPNRAGGGSINVDASTLIDNLKFTFMGTFEAQKGRWGFMTDLIYLNVGGSNNNTRNVSVDGHPLPIGVSTNLDLDLKGAVWELAGTYQAVANKEASVDILAGARLLDLKESLGYSFTGDVGPIVGPGRSGSSEVKVSYWDAIIGAKGKFSFGGNGEWFVPWYVDVGTGQSDLTWQAIGGLGYKFSWGSVVGGWRYLDYKFKSGSAVESLNFSGPMVGAVFSW